MVTNVAHDGLTDISSPLSLTKLQCKHCNREREKEGGREIERDWEEKTERESEGGGGEG